MKNNKHITIRLDEELQKRFKEKVIINRSDMSKQIKGFIIDYLKD